MDVLRELSKHGFRRAANLHWSQSETGTRFEFGGKDPNLWNDGNVIYAYVDLTGNRFLNVGHTGRLVRARFGDYQRWLNGLRKNDCDTPIRHYWLACLKACVPSKVEVWVKSSSSSRIEREAEEMRWIGLFRPILNRR